MKNDLKEMVNDLWEETAKNQMKADEAYENGDLGLSGYYKGMHYVYGGIASRLETILGEHEEDGK